MRTAKSKSLLEVNQSSECPECGTKTITQTRGERFCKNCGIIIQKHRIQAQETRSFSKKEAEKQKRTGTTITPEHGDKGFTTTIGYSNELSKLSNVEKMGQYKRLRKWQNRFTGKKRTRGKDSNILRRVASQKNIDQKTLRRAATVLNQFKEKIDNPTLLREAVAAASLHLATREAGNTVLMQDLADEAGTEKGKIGKAYRKIIRELDIGYIPFELPDIIFRYANRVELTNSAKLRAHELSKKVQEENTLSSRNPSTLLASCLYIGALLEGDKRTQEEIGEAVGVTKTTIRKGYKDIAEQFGIEDEIEEKSH